LPGHLGACGVAALDRYGLEASDRRVVLGELDRPIVVRFPLRGEWTVERTPAHRIPSHGTDVLGMRYA
jgi:hypothetical protein